MKQKKRTQSQHHENLLRKSFYKSKRRNWQQDLLEKMIEGQRKEDAREKEKYRKFFMNIVKLFSK